MVEFEQKSDEIWERFRKGTLTHDMVQAELDVLIQKYFPTFIKLSDFFERLENEVSNRVHKKIPMSSGYRTSIDRCFTKRALVTTQIVKESDFTNFWLSASWLEKPSKDDKETVKKLDVESLTKYYLLIFRSLIGLARSGYENTSQCRKLHAFLRLTKKAMLRHGVLKVKGDAFEEFLQHKQAYKSQKERLEESRKSGKKCFHCESTNVRSYNKVEWKCYSCGKRFRKH